MKTVRWIGVLGLAVWCVGAGAAAGSDGQPVKAEIKTGINGHAKGRLKVNINEANTADHRLPRGPRPVQTGARPREGGRRGEAGPREEPWPHHGEVTPRPVP